MGILKQIATKRFQHAVARCLIASIVLALLTFICYRLRFNLATCGFLYVVVVVLLSRTGDLVSSIIVSVIAALCLAHLAPPAYSFRVDNPLDLAAVFAFLITSLVIAPLVSKLRRMTEDALSNVNRGLIDAEERERARIARDLHDDIGQRMALLEVKLERVRTDGSNSSVEVIRAVDELQKETREISTDIQALAHTLHSPKLEYLGLVKTMKSFCKEFGQQQKVEIDFRSDDLPSPIQQDISLALFRVLQEALHNAAKHSGVRHFEVRLWETQGEIHLTVRDLGLGFNPHAAMRGTGLGLLSMQERLKLVKGQFSIDSQPKRGTTIHVRVLLDSGIGSERAAG